MLEQKIADKLDDLFSDGRINVYVLAALTRRTLCRQSTRVIEEWWDLHRAEASTFVDNKQAMLFDIAAYDVS